MLIYTCQQILMHMQPFILDSSVPHRCLHHKHVSAILSLKEQLIQSCCCTSGNRPVSITATQRVAPPGACTRLTRTEQLLRAKHKLRPISYIRLRPLFWTSFCVNTCTHVLFSLFASCAHPRHTFTSLS